VQITQLSGTQEPLSYSISKEIKQKIICGELKPGERIVESKIAKEFGVSQTPVREAIRELVTCGFLDQKKYSGTYVKKITVDEIRRTYVVRGELESLGARLFLENMTNEKLKELNSILLKLEHSAKERDIDAYLRFDTEFHDYIIKGSENSMLIRLWPQIGIQDWMFISTSIMKERLDYLALRHRLIYEAILAKDEAAVRDAIHQHLDELIESLKDYT